MAVKKKKSRGKGKKKATEKKRKTKARARPGEDSWEESFEKGMEDFGEEMGRLGENIGKKFGREFGRDFECRTHKMKWWCWSPLGLIGPFFGSIVCTVFVAVFFWIILAIAGFIGVGFLEIISLFLMQNLAIFFLLFLFLGYKDYFAKFYPEAFWPISPVLNAFGATIVLWLLVDTIKAANLSLDNAVLGSLLSFAEGKLLWAFIILVVFGYLLLALGKGHKREGCC